MNGQTSDVFGFAVAMRYRSGPHRSISELIAITNPKLMELGSTAGESEDVYFYGFRWQQSYIWNLDEDADLVPFIEVATSVEDSRNPNNLPYIWWPELNIGWPTLKRISTFETIKPN